MLEFQGKNISVCSAAVTSSIIPASAIVTKEITLGEFAATFNGANAVSRCVFDLTCWFAINLRENGLYILFDAPQRGITPGQFAAWYAPLANSKEASDSLHPDTCTEMIGSGVI